jgi:hypothetical protein
VRDDLEFDRGQNMKCLNVRFGLKGDMTTNQRNIRLSEPDQRPNPDAHLTQNGPNSAPAL